LQRSLEALVKALEGIDAEVLVVNDSANRLRGLQANEKISIIQNRGKGAATARNFGASLAKGSLLLFLDDDIIVQPRSIYRLFELHAAHPRSAFNFFWYFPEDLTRELPRTSFGRYLLHYKINSQVSRLIDKDVVGKELVSDYGVSSYFFSIERDLFLETGGYDESIPHAGVEDIILSKKLRRLGIPMFLSVKDVVYHNESDRLDLWQVMERYRRASVTMNAAVRSGHGEFERKFSVFKKLGYSVFLPFRKPVYRLSRLVPNLPVLDPLYFKWVNLLLGLSSYQGYRESK